MFVDDDDDLVSCKKTKSAEIRTSEEGISSSQHNADLMIGYGYQCIGWTQRDAVCVSSLLTLHHNSRPQAKWSVFSQRPQEFRDQKLFEVASDNLNHNHHHDFDARARSKGTSSSSLSSIIGSDEYSMQL